MLHSTNWWSIWLILILVIGGGLVLGKITEKPRIPDVVGYLLLGIVIGPWGLKLVTISNQSQVNLFILYLGAAMILFEGGYAVRLEVLKRTFITLTLLSTVGVLITTAVIGIAAQLIFHVSWDTALLLGAVISSTDPATLIPVFQRIPIIARLQQTIESESAFNDAIASVLVVTLVTLNRNPHSLHITQAVGTFFQSAGLGIAVGFVIGVISLFLVSESGWGVLREFTSVVMLFVVLSSFAIAQALHGSGFMAVFVAGIVVGNHKRFTLTLKPHSKRNIQHYFSANSLVFRMLIFTLLGAQVDFGRLHQWFWGGLTVAICLMFIARPIVVGACAAVDRRAAWKLRELAFMCWTRETGVVPAVLAGMLQAEKVPQALLISSVTFVVILTTVFVQGSSTGMVAKWLQLNVFFAEEEV